MRSELAEEYPLHWNILTDDFDAFSEVVTRLVEQHGDSPIGASPAALHDGRRHPLNRKDKCGNTALHLCAILQRPLRYAELLLQHGANLPLRNVLGWTCMQEAQASHNRELVKLFLRTANERLETTFPATFEAGVERLRCARDFAVDIEWQFKSIVPFIGRFLPSDTCRVVKRGSRVRLDFSLRDFSMKTGWIRGPSSVLFDPQGCLPCSSAAGRKEETDFRHALVFVDHEKQIFRCAHKKPGADDAEAELDNAVEVLVQSELQHAGVYTGDVTLKPRTKFFSSTQQTAEVGGYMCKIFDLQGLCVFRQVRDAHLPDDLKKLNKEREEELKKSLQNEPDEDKIAKIAKLQWSSVERYEFEPYAPPELDPVDYLLGRISPKSIMGEVKGHRKNVKSTLFLARDFPLTYDDLMPVLDVGASASRTLEKLQQYLSEVREHGFPVKLEMPLFMVLTATASFNNFRWLAKDERTAQEFPDEFFRVPRDYEETHPAVQPTPSNEGGSVSQPRI
ncbi:MAG: hypothetical protein MHM6MM_005615 [Cercozoa sp. M6MM]